MKTALQMRPAPDDLLAAAARGDRQAFAELYAETAGRLLGLAQRMLRDRAAAEEVVQESFVRIWLHAGDFRRERGPALGWMVTIVRNAALDRLRRERGAIPIDTVADRESWADPGPDPLAAAMTSADARALRGCLDELEEGPRRAITLAYWNGMSHEELAVAIGAPLGTVKSWIRRGLGRLKGCLEL